MMEWDNQQQVDQNGNLGVTVNGNHNGVNGNGGMYVKVMTDEQLETLRKQIAIYATICEQLVDMHKALSAQQDLAGGRLGGFYSDPMMLSPGGHKMTARQRWTPTPVQLQILESIFDQGNGTPSKQKIKDITTELSQHGQISETNVYNWFQNRRARSKRKQQVASSNNLNNNGESEVETEVESSHEKKSKPEELNQSHNNHNNNGSFATTPRAEDMCFQSPDMSSELHFLGVFKGDEQLGGKMGLPDSYDLYDHVDGYGMAG